MIIIIIEEDNDEVDNNEEEGMHFRGRNTGWVGVSAAGNYAMMYIHNSCAKFGDKLHEQLQYCLVVWRQACDYKIIGLSTTVMLIHITETHCSSFFSCSFSLTFPCSLFFPPLGIAKELFAHLWIKIYFLFACLLQSGYELGPWHVLYGIL